MTHAELLRSHADLAIKEGGMYYSGEYLSRIATTAESLEQENARLRELVTGLYKCWVDEGCEGCPMQDDDGWCVRDIRLRELGVEVPNA